MRNKIFCLCDLGVSCALSTSMKQWPVNVLVCKRVKSNATESWEMWSLAGQQYPGYNSRTREEGQRGLWWLASGLVHKWSYPPQEIETQGSEATCLRSDKKQSWELNTCLINFFYWKWEDPPQESITAAMQTCVQRPVCWEAYVHLALLPNTSEALGGALTTWSRDIGGRAEETGFYHIGSRKALEALKQEYNAVTAMWEVN